MNLVIVESPTKARTLTRFLGRQYRVKASMGHIRDLPKKSLGVDIEHNFKPTYVVDAGRKKVIKELRHEAKKADKIILATDPDREGEAIAYHIKYLLIDSNLRRIGRRKRKKKNSINSIKNSDKLVNDNFQRIVFHEITKGAVEEALRHPRGIDMALFDAQQARRILDRLVGYKLSPLLWRKVRRGLSAGRVQSVAVRFIVEREREIEKFKKERYFRVFGEFRGLREGRGGQGDSGRSGISGLEAELVEMDGERVEQRRKLKLFDGEYTVVRTILTNEKRVGEVVEEIKNYDYVVAAVDKKEIKRTPPPPLITSTLQQLAGRRFGFSAKRTMRVAQRLYERGLITYHRTDSLNLAEKFLHNSREFIKEKYGREYALDKPRRFKTKSKVAQEAHEAIRPTKLSNGLWVVDSEKKDQGDWGKSGTSGLNRDERRVYELIWKRAVASQMKEAVFDKTVIEIENKGDRGNEGDKGSSEYKFKTVGSVIKFDGFLKVLGYSGEDKILPTVSVGEELKVARVGLTKHQTSPPPRYSEASLVKTLEKEDIGRPSTYAPIISRIQSRQYVEKVEGRFAPTNLGIAVNDFLVKNFDYIVDIPFTARMEDDLDKIANGQVKWVPVISAFYEPFEKKLAEVLETAERVEVAVEETKEICPQCGGKLVIRIGRFGKFLACSKFPKCKFTKNLLEKTGLKCPQCGAEIIIKKTKKGKRFYGCSHYPKCKFAAWKKEEIKNRT